jgi:hypothetical protein
MIGRATLVLFAAALLLGASNVTGKPITDIRMIEGKWRGQIKLAGGPYEIYYLTVNPDATIVAKRNVRTPSITSIGAETSRCSAHALVTRSSMKTSPATVKSQTAPRRRARSTAATGAIAPARP